MKTDDNKDDEFCGSNGSLVDQSGAVVLQVEPVEEEHTSCTTCKNKNECGTGTRASVSISKEAESPDENEETQPITSSSTANVVLDASCLLLQRVGHEKRRTQGRSARRRRRKFLDIQQREEEIRLQYMLQQQNHQQKEQEQQADGGNNNAAETFLETSFTNSKEESCSSSIPVDRDKVWPAVAELRRRQFATSASVDHHEMNADDVDDFGGWRGPADERLLIGQLGFLPGNAIRVCTRVKDLRKKGQEQQQHQDTDHYCLSMERLLLLASSKNKNSSSNNSNGNNNDYDDIVLLDHDDCQVPVVLQLYPLVYRDEYTGGKGQDGRKVAKGRKRRIRKVIVVGQQQQHHHHNNNAEYSISTPPVSANHDDKPSQTPVAADLLSNNAETTAVVVEPFPTIYWLTHPLLRVWISQLELDGLGVRLEQRLAAPGNEALLERMKQAHEAYAMERAQLLTPADVALVQARHWDDALLTTNRGVAGVRNPKAVKCLHAHAAHYLSVGKGSHDNVVGDWVMQEVHKMLNKRSRGDDNKIK